MQNNASDRANAATRRQAIVIANAGSRNGSKAYKEVPRLLRERGVEVLDARLVGTNREVCKLVKRAARRKQPLIVVCGGDGTLSRAACVLAKRRSVLGIVPAGTGNSFALGIGIEDTFESAADAIAFGHKSKIDLGRINGVYFTNFVTVGLDSNIADETQRPLKKLLGPAAYGVTGVVHILRHRPFRADLRWKGHRLRVKTDQIIIANGRFYGHQPIAPSATVDDGRLTIFVRETHSRLDVFQTYLALLRGEQHALDGVHLWSTPKTVKLRTSRKECVAVDGEAFGATPLRVSVVRRALRIMVPYTGVAPALAS